MVTRKVQRIRSATVMVLLATTTLAGCATEPRYGHLFAGKPTLGNIHIFASSRRIVRTAALNALVARDFQVKRERSGRIVAVNNYKTHASSEKTYIITADINVEKVGSNKTQVAVTASQKTIVHQEWHTWWHLLFIIPIFPTSTHYKDTTTDASAITSKAFYQNLFSDINQQIKQHNVIVGNLPNGPLPKALTGTTKKSAAVSRKTATAS